MKSSFLLLGISLILACSSAACSSTTGDGAAPGIDGAAPPSPPVDGAASPSVDGAASPSVDGAASPPGVLGTQAFDVSEITLDPSASYRLVVAFTQFDDDYARTPVDVVLDVPFPVGPGLDLAARTIDLSALRPPAAHTVFCPRKDKKRGEAPGACDADATYRVAIGYVIVVRDGNGNGKADFTTSGGDGRAGILAPDLQAGIAVGAILYSEMSGSVMPSFGGSKPILLDSPVPKGFSIYEAHRPADAVFDRLRAPSGPIKVTARGPNLT